MKTCYDRSLLSLASSEKAGGKTGLQAKGNKDASSWEGSPGLTQLSGANTGGNSEECHLMQDHHTPSTEAISSSQKTCFS